MDDLDAFLVRITEESLRDIEDESWCRLRKLTPGEQATCQYLRGLRHRVEEARAKVAEALPETRRRQVASRQDLNDEELDLLGKLILWLDRSRAASEAFWSGLRYEFRNFEQIVLDRDTYTLFGRRFNRRTQPESPGRISEAEERRLCALLGVPVPDVTNSGTGVEGIGASQA